MSFGRSRAQQVLQQAAARVNLDASGAELLRLGENALYRLADQAVVVRIARGKEHWSAASKEVAVARWLAASGLTAAETWDVDQPIDVEGHPVTFWNYLDGRRGGPNDVAHLGSVLRQLHSLQLPTTFRLPSESVLDRVKPRVRAASISNRDKEFVFEVTAKLEAEIGQLTFQLQETVVHGDAHVQNLMFVGDQPVLIDFERVAFGQPEWDLAVTATEYVTAGWWTDEQYATFVDAYGYDVMSWAGFDTLRRVNEIKMTTWLMQNIGESPEIEREYHVRMQTIRGERNDRAWSTF